MTMTDVTVETGQAWRAVLAVIGEPTSDGRVFDSLTWREPPLTLRAEPNLEQHDGGAPVGRVDRITQDGNLVIGEGVFDTSPAALEVVRLVDAQMARGVSIDAAVQEMTVDDAGIAHFDAEIIAVTVVQMPAFAEAMGLTLVDSEDAASDMAPDMPMPDKKKKRMMPGMSVDLAASGSTDLPLADRARAWDGPGAEARVRSWAGATDSPNDRYAQAFFIIDGPRDQFGSYHLGFADVIGGRLTAVPRGIMACAAAIQGSRGASNPAFQAAKPRVAAYYRKMDMTPPWDNAGAVLEDWGAGLALVASGTRSDRPPEWFTDQGLARRERLHLDADERIWGHVYGWGECHTGSMPGACVQVPRDIGFDYFNLGGGVVACANGQEIHTGPIVIAADHAKVRGISWLDAHDHYAHSGLAVADVVAGADSHGIWVAGALRPGTAPELVHAFRASRPSVDCRMIGGRWQLLALLSVNMPGFPALVAGVDNGRVTALVASGAMLEGDCGCGGGEALAEVTGRLQALERLTAGLRAQRAEAALALEADLALDRASLAARLAEELALT